MTDHAGTATLEVRDIGLDSEHVVVLRADDVLHVSPELVRGWRSGEAKHVRLDGSLVTFGTAGEGLGRLTYDITYEPRLAETATERGYAILRRRP